MQKQAANTFVGGLNTDRHPLTAQNTELVDARNIDLIQVGEGYQLILQKREGNTELLYDDGVNPPVSAGLPTGYIPLAVKEFNNIAYILSVNPDTGAGEIGTFPSPDYDGFVYDTGAPIIGGATITGSVWDPTADAPDYAFSLNVNTYAEEGLDRLEDGTSLAATFTITNDGIFSNTYLIELTGDTTGISMFADGIAYDPVTGIGIGPGDHKHITFTIDGAFILTPTTTFTVTATVDQVNGTPDPQEFEFSFHTHVVLQFRRFGTWMEGTSSTDWTQSTMGDTFTNDLVSKPNSPAVYEWRSNATPNAVSVVEVFTPNDASVTTVKNDGDKTYTVSLTPSEAHGHTLAATFTGAAGGSLLLTISQMAP